MTVFMQETGESRGSGKPVCVRRGESRRAVGLVEVSLVGWRQERAGLLVQMDEKEAGKWEMVTN